MPGLSFVDSPSMLTMVAYSLTAAEKKLVGSGWLATETTVALELAVLDPDPGPHPGADPLDLRFVHRDADLHLGQVGQAQDGLLFADLGAFLDLRGLRRTVAAAALVVGVHHHAGLRRRMVHFCR